MDSASHILTPVVRRIPDIKEMHDLEIRLAPNVSGLQILK
jgi:hypothetical protein